MAKIAAAVERALERRRESGCSGRPEPRVLARGEGWSVADVVCASGPHDQPYEERHEQYSIAIVAAGVFRYRSAHGAELMTPGSVMLGSAGQTYECGHEHGAGDRCIAFWYDAGFFERLAADAGARAGRPMFGASRVPPVRTLSLLIARACAGVTGAADVAWDDIAISLAAAVVGLAHGVGPTAAPARAVARVGAIVRQIEREPGASFDIARLARTAHQSPYHFLRTFERITGATPHQYVLRTRLREAARRLKTERGRVLDVALDCGFGDVSNFNRMFRAEFGVSPRVFRVSR